MRIVRSELTGVLEARAGASDLACHVAVLRFEPAAESVRHAVAVEIPLSELRFAPGPAGARARLQVLVRVGAAADPEVRQHDVCGQMLPKRSQARAPCRFRPGTAWLTNLKKT